MGGRCGGELEEAAVTALARALSLEDRFDATPMRVISVYRPRTP